MLEPGFYNLDCMDGMKQFPDKFFDLAVVDPPYGIGADRFNNGAGAKDHAKGSTAKKLRVNQGAGKLKNRVLNQSDCSWDIAPPPKAYFDELRRVSMNQIIWGGQLFRLATYARNHRLGQNTAVGELFTGRNGMDIV